MMMMTIFADGVGENCARDGCTLRRPPLVYDLDMAIDLCQIKVCSRACLNVCGPGPLQHCRAILSDTMSSHLLPKSCIICPTVNVVKPKRLRHRPQASARAERGDENSPRQHGQELSRRAYLLGSSCLSLLLFPVSTDSSSTHAAARAIPPDGFSLTKSRQGGYQFFVPDTWTPLNGVGSFGYRDAKDAETNLFVSVSSPTSAPAQIRALNSFEKEKSLEKIGQLSITRTLQDFSSTRIGVSRPFKLLNAVDGTTKDGQRFFELVYNIQSIASENEFAPLPSQRTPSVEWDRRFYEKIIFNSNQAYGIRIQCAESKTAEIEPLVRTIFDSFRVME